MKGSPSRQECDLGSPDGPLSIRQVGGQRGSRPLTRNSWPGHLLVSEGGLEPPAAAMDLDLLRAALAGTNAVSFTLDPLGPDGPMFEQTTQLHVEDVPATFDPVLSAIGWLNWDIERPGTLTLLETPGAATGRPAIVSRLVNWG